MAAQFIVTQKSQSGKSRITASVSSAISSLVMTAVLLHTGESFADSTCVKRTNVSDLKQISSSVDLSNSVKAFAKTSPKIQSNSDEQTTDGDSLEKDPRTKLNRLNNKEYNPIGVVKTALGRGTAWATDDCLVLTAKHNVGSNQNVIGQEVDFYVGQSTTPGKNFEYREKGEVVASGNPEGKGFDGELRDWVLIRTKSRIGKKVGVIPTSQYSGADAKTCKTLEVAGFPGEKSLLDLWWQGNCNLKSNGDTLFLLGCPITQGNSGGPLLCREVDGTLNAIGMTNWADPNAPQQDSIAMNFSYDWQKIKAAIQKYSGTCSEPI